MKKFLLLLIFCFLCGCTSEYQLNIKGKEIEENINLFIHNSEIVEEDLAPDMSLKSRDSIEYLKTSDLYPIEGNKRAIYDKEIEEIDNTTAIKLKYKYKNAEFKNSKVINECFENKNITISKEKISIHLFGKFSCLENDVSALEFKIVTNNKVESANIAYGMFDNEYIWKIDGANVKNVDIQIDLLTESKYEYYGVRVLGIILIIIVVVIGVYAYSKISNRKNINEI